MSYSKPTISNYNASPPPDDASQISSNVVRWSNHITKIGDPLKSYIDAVNNATESAWNDLASTSTTSDGAALVGYKHGGSTGTFTTGAVARDVQGKLDDYLNVFDFIPKNLHSAIKDYTSTTNVSTYIQDAIDLREPLFIPPGKYVIENELTSITNQAFSIGPRIRGAGMQSTIFDNKVASGALLRIDQSTVGNAHFHYGTDLYGFSIVGNASVLSSNGIEARGLLHARFANIQAKSLTGTGILMMSSVNDLDQSGWLDYSQCRFEDVLRGIDVDPAVNASAIYQYNITGCLFVRAKKAAMRLVASNAHIHKNTFFNGSKDIDEASLLIRKSGTENRHIDITNNLFESDEFGGIEIESCIHGRIEGNSISSGIGGTDAGGATFGIKIGHNATATTRYLEVRNNRHVIGAATASNPYNVYDLGDKAEHIDIISPLFDGINGAVKYSLTSTAKTNNNHIEAQGRKTLYQRGKEQYTETVSAGGTVSIDLINGNWQKFTITTTSAVTINPPPSATTHGGQEFRLTIINSSGGAINVTLGTGFSSYSDYVNPANGFKATCDFAYEPGTSWQQNAPWFVAT